MELQVILDYLMSWLLVHGVRIVGIIIAAFLVKRAGRVFIEKIVRKAVKGTPGDGTAEKKREDTLIRMFTSVLAMVIWVMVVLMIIPEFGVNIGPLLAGAGIVGIAIGLGAQQVIQDFLAGFFIVFEDQYRVGDVVCVDGTCGLVEDLNLRRTILRSADGVSHIMSNGHIKKASNLSKQFSRVDFKIGVAYKEDVDRVIKVLNRVGKEMAKDPEWKDAILKPPQALGVDEFADSAIIITVRGDTKPLKQWDVSRELRRRIKITFDKEGIEIPFPQTVVWPQGEWKK